MKRLSTVFIADKRKTLLTNINLLIAFTTYGWLCLYVFTKKINQKRKEIKSFRQYFTYTYTSMHLIKSILFVALYCYIIRYIFFHTDEWWKTRLYRHKIYTTTIMYSTKKCFEAVLYSQWWKKKKTKKKFEQREQKLLENWYARWTFYGCKTWSRSIVFLLFILLLYWTTTDPQLSCVSLLCLYLICFKLNFHNFKEVWATLLAWCRVYTALMLSIYLYTYLFLEISVTKFWLFCLKFSKLNGVCT